MRKIATLTKETAEGLSVWTFCNCDGTFVAFGGTTNRCKVFRNQVQFQDCMLNFAEYGYTVERHTKAAKRGNTPKPVRRVPQSDVAQISLPVEDLPTDDAPRPEEGTLVKVNF